MNRRDIIKGVAALAPLAVVPFDFKNWRDAFGVALTDSDKEGNVLVRVGIGESSHEWWGSGIQKVSNVTADDMNRMWSEETS